MPTRRQDARSPRERSETNAFPYPHRVWTTYVLPFTASEARQEERERGAPCPASHPCFAAHGGTSVHRWPSCSRSLSRWPWLVTLGQRPQTAPLAQPACLARLAPSIQL